MSNYSYEAVDTSGLRKHGTLDVLNQTEAIRRIKEMGLFPLNVRLALAARQRKNATQGKAIQLPDWMTKRSIKPAALMVFTRQLATLLDAGFSYGPIFFRKLT